jgi:signal transduction histidine kinase
MNSTSQVEREAQRERPTRARVYLERMRRLVGRPPALRLCPHARRLAGRLARLRGAVERVLRIGITSRLPVDAQKRIRLCNIFAVSGAAIMAVWAYLDAAFGDLASLPWELGFLAGFAAVLAVNAKGAHRAARFLLIINGNLCVLAGALLFTEPSGGVLPFFGLAAIALLLFGPREWPLATLSAALSALLLVLCKTGLAVSLFGIDAKPAPSWYFAANTATTFALAFVVPFFFYRSNLKAEASLQRMGQEKLKRLIDADLIGVVRGRLSGRIEDANDTFLSLVGASRHDLATGALDLRMIAPVEPFASELRHGPTSVYERDCRRKDGSTVPILVGVSLLDDSDDEVVGFVLDLTAQKRVEAQRAMLEDSREALRLRDLFNSIASHELKTPLTALLLNLELLAKRMEKEVPDSSPLRSRVDRCESAAVRMGELIDALLDVARIHRGRFTLDVRETDVVAAVRKVVGGFEAGVPKDRRHRITVRSNGAVTAKLDTLRFDQIVTNLLSNAVKYGAGKPIEVRVNHDRNANLAHIEVVDGGPGIDPRMADKIFEPFQRASSTEPIPGLGLGLYVVKLIVESHGGHIGVDSTPGCGSRFIVDLPCAGTQQAMLQ